jgi:hypothetical protein
MPAARGRRLGSGALGTTRLDALDVFSIARTGVAPVFAIAPSKFAASFVHPLLFN